MPHKLFESTRILRLLSLCFFWLVSGRVLSAQEPVLILTHSYNRPDFIEIQHRTFQKFFQDPYIFYVFNDAPEESMAKAIEDVCTKCGIPCVRIPQAIHTQPYLPRKPDDDWQNPAVRCANVVQYSLDTLGFAHPGLVLLIDADMFLIRDFSLVKTLQEAALAGVPQKRSHISYVWNGLLFFNMHTLPDKETLNFNCTSIDGIALDVGGATYPYFQSHPDLPFFPIDNLYLAQWNTLTKHQKAFPALEWLFNQHPQEIEFLLDYTFLHYRSGSNWNARNPEYHRIKTDILYQFIEKIL